MSRGLRALAWLVPLALAGVAHAGLAHAQSSAPVIEPGREAEVLGLLAPYELGAEVTPEHRLTNVAIEAREITCEVRGPDETVARLHLAHPDAVPEPDRTSASFAMRLDASDDASRAALVALADAVGRNDAGGFFRVAAQPEPPVGGSTSFTSERPIFDGALLALLAAALLVVLVVRQLRIDGPRFLWALLAVVVVGAVARIALSPHAVLGAWPFRRTTTFMELVLTGPTLALSTHALGPLSYFDVVTYTTLLFAILTPIAIYGHARMLLGDPKVAIVAAGIVATLPEHIRFSFSEVAFIPSIALSSTTFYLVHVALKDPSRRWAGVAFVAFPVVAAGMFVARPLNEMFLPLLWITSLYLARHDASLRRRIAAAAILTAVATVTTLLHFLPAYATQTREGLSLWVLGRGVAAIFSLRHDTLINPWITPPLLTIAAISGGVWRYRAGDRDKVLFLVGWLVAFFIAHAYVLPPTVAMQARYHLHLVVPFVFLAGLGVVEVLRRWPRWGVALCVYAGLSPLIHLSFIRDVAYDDIREHAFVTSAGDRIPAGCTVLEYVGAGEEVDAPRFTRIGERHEGFARTSRFVVVPIGAPPEADDPLRPEVRALLASPPECLVYYEGLLCWSAKDPSEPIAPACEAMRGTHRLEPLSHTAFAPRVYDDRFARGYAPDLESIRLTLSRVRPPARAPR